MNQDVSGCQEPPITPRPCNYGILRAEKYDPGAAEGSRWAGLSGAPRFDRWTYPFLFLLPSGNVFYAGRNTRTLPAGPGPPYFQSFNGTAVLNMGATPTWGPNTSGLFEGTSAIMYRPGKIMKCGRPRRPPEETRDPTAWVDLTTPTSENSYAWTDDASQLANKRMLARAEQNLTMLPTGDVLVTGGRREHGDNSLAEPTAQVWRPGLHEWSEELAADPSGRGYHSTAILLPDGRILSAGGNAVAGTLAHEATVYEPPYLFKSDGSLRSPSERPQVTGLPGQIAPEQVFTVCVPSSQNISSVALVRPGATTHAFNQDQHYVPLSFERTTSGPTRLLVTAPGSLNHAPPGDYLLFVVDSTYAPATPYADRVPSVGKWISVASTPGYDPCDGEPPGLASDLWPEIVSSNELWLVWTGPPDDAGYPNSGAPARFDLRASLGPIQTEEAWGQAIQSETESVPGPAGSPGSGGVSNLQPCTWHHFQVRTRDDKDAVGQISGFHPDVMFKTMCDGPGGGFAAHEAPAEEGVAGTSTSSAGPTALELTVGTLLVRTDRTKDGGWQISLRLATEADGLASGARDIVVEREGQSGTWDKLGQFTPGESQNLLGVCSLRERGRVAIPGVYGLEQVVTHLRHGSQGFVLGSAQHSRLGSLGGEFLTSGGSVELIGDDVLDLTYQPSAEAPEDASDWYLVISRQGTATPATFSQSRDRAALPTRFALHQNEPNPAGSAALIRFDLPVACPVKLEVFDLLGRRVATIANGAYRAGYHAVDWDLRTRSGAPARAGVYVYRLTAGAFRAQRKMSVLP